MISSDDHSKRAWVTGDPIPKVDRDNVRDLIYAGFSRRLVASKLGLHKDLVGSVFDEYSPLKFPKLSDESIARIKEMIAAGACLGEMAEDLGVSEASVRKYVHSLGVHPRTLTPKYLREQKLRGKNSAGGSQLS